MPTEPILSNRERILFAEWLEARAQAMREHNTGAWGSAAHHFGVCLKAAIDDLRDGIQDTRTPQGKPSPLEVAEVAAQQVGRLIAGQMPENWGFVLLLASFGQDGHSTYTSNIVREDVPPFLRGMADNIGGMGEPEV